MPELIFNDIFQLGVDDTEYRLITENYISETVFNGRDILKIDPEGLRFIAREAMREVSFKLSPVHLEQWASALNDPDASENDKTVILALLKNAEVAAKGILPICQDTGTATIKAKKGQQIWTGVRDKAYLSKGVIDTYTEQNLRYSQNLPLSVYKEVNSGNNMPALIDIQAVEGMEYQFFFMAKGGGSSNKTMLFQETKAILNPLDLKRFLAEKMKTLGTAACPPYHLAFVIGGLSPEMCLETAKLASTGYLDSLPTCGNNDGQAFRDAELEKFLLHEAYNCGFGAQFGGKYFALSARVIRLPRHGGSCPIGMAVSCSAHRNIKAKINKSGIWLEKMENDPGRLIPEKYRKKSDSQTVKIDLNRPIKETLQLLDGYPVGSSFSLDGTIIVARDIAHSKIKARLENGEALPQYLTDYPIYYAGPAKTPDGMACGSLGPTTGGRMDSYVELFQQNGGSLIMIAKGNRSQQVADACKKYGGFYLGAIGGSAAYLAQENIKSIEIVDYPELGMEAVWKIEVSNFIVFMLIDNKGNDFYRQVDQRNK